MECSETSELAVVRHFLEMSISLFSVELEFRGRFTREIGQLFISSKAYLPFEQC